MDAEYIIAAFVAFVGFAVLITAYATLAPVAGIWRRETETLEEEYIQLEQVGPFVTGKRNVDGGNHMYSGLQIFGSVRLSRRDFGLPALIAQGFPSAIAKKINGSVVGKMRLSRKGGKVLSGWFWPQKILFDEPSARVLSRNYQGALQRYFQKTELTELPNLKGSGVRSANLPPPAQAPKKKKTTF